MDYGLIFVMTGSFIIPGILIMIGSFISDSKNLSDETRKLGIKIALGGVVVFGFTMGIIFILAVIDGGLNKWFLLGILLILAIIRAIKNWINGG